MFVVCYVGVCVYLLCTVLVFVYVCVVSVVVCQFVHMLTCLYKSALCL